MKWVFLGFVFMVNLYATLAIADIGDVGPAEVWSESQINDFAKTIQSTPNDSVVIITMNGCPYCDQAMQWLDHFKFHYTECNMNDDRRCVELFQAIHGQGTPALIIKNKGRYAYMTAGFNPDDFINALR
jgi:glutaredoxin